MNFVTGLDDTYDAKQQQKETTAAVDRLFEILHTEESSYKFRNEVVTLLQRFPDAVQAISSERIPRYPLHMACKNNAPMSVIRALLMAWPDAVRIRPGGNRRDGPLPLHDACENGKSLPTIQLLVEAWPDSLKELGRTNQGHGSLKKLPLECALRNGHVAYEIIEYLVQQWPPSVEYLFQGDTYALHYACGVGVSISIIQFLYRQAPYLIRTEC